MKTNVSGITSLVLVLVAFSSLIAMFALTRIDSIVQQDLYRYNLSFSYEWAMPYWTMTTLVFAMGWINIFTAIIFQFYVLLYGPKEAEVIVQKEALKTGLRDQPAIQEEPTKAEKENGEEMKPKETMLVETAEAEKRETIAPPMEVELGTHKESEEARKPEEEPREEPVTVVEEESEEAETLVEAPQEAQGPVEEITPQEYVETEELEEVDGQQEQEAEIMERVETEQKLEEKFEEPQEPVDVQPREEISYAEEEEIENEYMPRETVETEDQETAPHMSEIEPETTENEDTQTQASMPPE